MAGSWAVSRCRFAVFAFRASFDRDDNISHSHPPLPPVLLCLLVRICAGKVPAPTAGVASGAPAGPVAELTAAVSELAPTGDSSSDGGHGRFGRMPS